ncbi:MAG TPA: GNAT family N-acetyltransferase [Trichocoleus sp.]
MQQIFKTFLIRDWQPADREQAFAVIRTVLPEYGLTCEPDGSDQDAYAVETFYLQSGGEFWVVEQEGSIVGTAGYYPIERGEKAVEIRKMYLLPVVRGQGLGRHLLQALEQAIWQRGFEQIWIETASVLKEAVKLYEQSGYQPASGVETARCDRVYRKDLPLL